MAFGGKMHHPLRAKCRKGSLHRRPVGNVGMKKTKSRKRFDRVKVFEIAGIGQFIAHQMSHQC